MIPILALLLAAAPPLDEPDPPYDLIIMVRVDGVEVPISLAAAERLYQDGDLCDVNYREATGEEYLADDFPEGLPPGCEDVPLPSQVEPDSFGWGVRLVDLCGRPYTTFSTDDREYDCVMIGGEWQIRQKGEGR